jgi:hypothetical protein
MLEYAVWLQIEAAAVTIDADHRPIRVWGSQKEEFLGCRREAIRRLVYWWRQI